MADQPIPLRRYLAANAVALAPSAVAIAALYGSGFLAGRPALIAMAGIAAVTGFLVQRYLGSLARFARFVGELSGEREPVMPRLSFAPATEELATAAAMLSAGWRRQRASIDNLAASAQAIVDGLPDALVSVDRHRRIVRTNLAAALLLGSSSGPERDVSTVLRQPQLLLLDEPTSGVDVSTRHDVLHLLADLHEDGVAIVLTTHDLNGLAAHLPHIVCVNGGIVADGSPAEVITPEVLERTFGARMEVLEHLGMRVVVDEAPHMFAARGVN